MPPPEFEFSKNRKQFRILCVFSRMNLLSMTFGKYIDANLCCFIPGKIIDEIYNVLAILKTKCDPPSTYEVLQVRQ